MKDIIESYEKAAISYKENINSLKGIMEGEELLRLQFDFKMEAMMLYNQLFYFNQDTFNNSQYLAWYNDYKRKLESQIANLETKVSDKNMEGSMQLCKEILQKEFDKIKEKLHSQSYSSNLEDYIQDHESFLTYYLNNSKGPQKVSILVDFLTTNKPEVIKSLLNTLEIENNSRLEEAIKKFNEAEKKKIEVESNKKRLDDVAKENTEKIENMNSELEKKKREIIDLSERIKLIELDIKDRREQSKNLINN